jgi:hypothetical protein
VGQALRAAPVTLNPRDGRRSRCTRVLDDLRFRPSCGDAGEHSAQCVSTHNPWVVGSSPTRPTTVASPPRYDELAVRFDATVQITSINIQLRYLSYKT